MIPYRKVLFNKQYARARANRCSKAPDILHIQRKKAPENHFSEARLHYLKILNEQIHYAVDEQNGDKRRAQSADIQRPQLTEFHGAVFGMRRDFGKRVFGLPNVTDVNAGQYSGKRQQERVGERIEQA